MEYYYRIIDENRFTHSIDMVVYKYKLLVSDLSVVFEELEHIAKVHDARYWSKKDLLPCSQYNFYSNVIHIEKIDIRFGYYKRKKNKSDYVKLNVLQIRLNPNKYVTDALTTDILNWIYSRCTDGHLHMYDYAIDVPYSMNTLQIVKSRKEKGLYKGTLYRGQRSSHGFLKIYNKAKEQDLDYELTRVEHTLDADKPLSLEEIWIANSDSDEDLSELDTLNQNIVKMCMLLKEQDLDYMQFIDNLNYRRKQKLLPFLVGNCMKIEYDRKIIQALIDEMNVLFNASKDSGYGKEAFREKRIIKKTEMNSFNDEAVYQEYISLRPTDEDEAIEEQYYKYICDVEAYERPSELVWSFAEHKVKFRWKEDKKNAV